MDSSAAVFGVWRSWLAHLVWDQRVESSSLFTPTANNQAFTETWMLVIVYWGVKRA